MLRNKYVVVSVGILLIGVIAYNIKFFTSREAVTHTGVTPRAETVKSLSTKTHTGTLEQEDRNPWKRDPFALQTVYAKPAYSEGLHLTGIVKRDGKSYALISGRVYGVNDRVGNAVIKEIKKHSVVFFINGKTEEIAFNDYTVLKEKKK